MCGNIHDSAINAMITAIGLLLIWKHRRFHIASLCARRWLSTWPREIEVALIMQRYRND